MLNIWLYAEDGEERGSVNGAFGTRICLFVFQTRFQFLT